MIDTGATRRAYRHTRPRHAGASCGIVPAELLTTRAQCAILNCGIVPASPVPEHDVDLPLQLPNEAPYAVLCGDAGSFPQLVFLVRYVYRSRCSCPVDLPSAWLHDALRRVLPDEAAPVRRSDRPSRWASLHYGGTMRIEEIAALAGVSRSTVSRAINNEPRVSAETRQRIEGIIREHGYHPNAVARSLRRRRAQTIGIVIHHTMSDSVTSPYHAIIMRAVTDVCEERSYNLMLSPAARLSPDRYADIIENGAVDGLIVTTPLVGRPFLAWLHETGFPFVLIGRQDDLPGINRVCADDEQGGRLAAQHLLSLGYRRLGLLSGPRDHDGASARIRGFIDAVRAAGLDVDASSIVESGFTIAAGESGMHELLAMGTRPRPSSAAATTVLLAPCTQRVRRPACAR